MFRKIVFDAPFHKDFGAKSVVVESGLGFAVFGARYEVTVKMSFAEFVERDRFSFSVANKHSKLNFVKVGGFRSAYRLEVQNEASVGFIPGWG